MTNTPLLRINDALLINVFNVTKVKTGEKNGQPCLFLYFADGTTEEIDNPLEIRGLGSFLDGVSERLELPDEDEEETGGRDFSLGTDTAIDDVDANSAGIG